MFEPKKIYNKGTNYNKMIINTSIHLNEQISILISVNPVYDWLDENIDVVSYKLLKGFITSIVPLGDAGKKYFKRIVHKRVGFIIELWKLYNQLQKIYLEGNLKNKILFRITTFRVYRCIFRWKMSSR